MRSKIRNLTYELAHKSKVIENISGARGSADRLGTHDELLAMGGRYASLQRGKAEG